MPRGGVGALSGLERAATGAQLLLLTGGEQQCIVDAGAEPEHAAQRRREPGHVGRGGGPHQRAEAEPDAGERRAERVARGAQVAQHGDQQEDGDGEADHLADREPAGGGSVDRLAGHGDVDARSLEAGGGVLEPVAGGRVEIGRGLVVADRREGGAAVVREPAGGLEGILDRGDVRLAVDLGERGLDVALGAGPLERASPLLKTTTACVPDWASKRFSRRSWACWDSMPGTVKSSLKLPPAATAPPITAVTASNTTRVAARGRRPTRDAMRERRVVMARTITRLSLKIN